MLALLDRGPAHGYELKRAHDELFSDVAPPVNVGQIYVTLTRLEKDGSVVHRTEKGTDGPDRKVYQLTPLGRKALESWLCEPSDLPVGKSDVVLKLVAGLVRDGTVAPAVAEHRARCIHALRHLVSQRLSREATDQEPADQEPAGQELTGQEPAGPLPTGQPPTHRPVAALGGLLREASVLHLQAELRWLDLVDERLNRDGTS
jgi:DNA-binding PadR family transcriptional regulator